MPTPFSRSLKFWRKTRGLSQLRLSVVSGVSTRHLSYLENDKSKPSEQLILKLADALGLPLADQNALLTSAGCATKFKKSSLDSERLKSIDTALDLLIGRHEPYPGFVLDRDYNIVKTNRAFAKLVQQLVGVAHTRFSNFLELCSDSNGLRNRFVCWPDVRQYFISRLNRELMLASNPFLESLYLDLVAESDGKIEPIAGPVLDLEIKHETGVLKFFSTTTTFGGPQDIAVENLRIDFLFPSDDQTKAFFENQ